MNKMDKNKNFDKTVINCEVGVNVRTTANPYK